MRRAVVAVAALFAASLLAALVHPVLSAEPGLPKITGSVPRYGADAARAFGVKDLKALTEPMDDDGVAVIVPSRDRIYQLYNFVEDPLYGDLGVIERDLETFKVTRSKIIADRAASLANGPNGAEWVSTVDHKNGRLIIAYSPPGGLQGRAGGQMPGFITLDLNTFDHVDSTFPNVLADMGGALLPVAGLEYDEGTDTVLMLQPFSHGVGSLGNALFLSGWSADELLRGGELPQVTPRPIRACRRDPLNDNNSQYLSPILIASGPDLDGDGSIKTWVTIPCYSSTFSTNVVIVRMDRDTALDPHATQEKAVVAPAGVTNWAFDTRHGRLFLVNNSAETDAWVYEVSTNAFVGIIALSPRGRYEANSLSLGVDEVSGRLYGRAESYGLMITAAAQDPVPQADVYPRLSAGGSFRLLVDAKRNRLLSLPGTSGSSGTPGDAYEVIDIPPPLPAPPRQDPDTRTAQVDEQPGKTVAQYSGNASAYGLRVLLSRGISGAIPTNGNNEAGQFIRDVNSYCGFTDRELVLARVAKTEMSNNSRFARAAAVDPDNATIIDLKAPSRCDAYNAYTGNIGSLQQALGMLATTGVLGDLDRAGVPASESVNNTLSPRTTWDYRPADCSTPNGEDEAGPNSSPLVGSTSVDCGDGDEIKATAESRAKPLDLADVHASKAKAWTTVKRDKDKGLVSTATARLEGVRIGEVSIGYIENSATSYAKGRTGTARTEFEKPRIGYVSGPNIPSCTDACDIDRVLKQLNVVLSGRAEFRRIEPESRLAKGTPGGYEAGIIKSEKQQASDNSLTGDKSVEIPALELVVYNDNAHIGRARQVYQFAGVRADSHYGIQLAGAGSPGGGAGVGDVIDGVTGDVVESVGELPNGGVPLKVHVPGGENIIKRTVRQTFDYADYSLRIIFNNPREAMVMATVWLLMWGPYVASRRRRALKAVTAASPEGTRIP